MLVVFSFSFLRQVTRRVTCLLSQKVFDFLGSLLNFTCSAEVNSACAKVLPCKTLDTPDSRRLQKVFDFLGSLLNFTCSAEINSACAEILLHKMLVTPDSRQFSFYQKTARNHSEQFSFSHQPGDPIYHSQMDGIIEVEKSLPPVFSSFSTVQHQQGNGHQGESLYPAHL